MKKEKNASASVDKAKAKKNENGICSVEENVVNSKIMVELFNEDDSIIENSDLAHRIGKCFESDLKWIIQGGFNFETACGVKSYVEAIENNTSSSASVFNYRLYRLLLLCQTIDISFTLTLSEPCNGIKEVIVQPCQIRVVTSSCYDQLEENDIGRSTTPFAYGKETNLTKVGKYILRSFWFNIVNEIFYEALNFSKNPTKYAKWIKECKVHSYRSEADLANPAASSMQGKLKTKKWI